MKLNLAAVRKRGSGDRFTQVEDLHRSGVERLEFDVNPLAKVRRRVTRARHRVGVKLCVHEDAKLLVVNLSGRPRLIPRNP